MYQFKTEPWDHQRKALRRAWKKTGYAYLMEMGTGKSKVDVDEACIYYEEGLIDAWIVLAPKGVYRNWELKEVPTHMPDRIREAAVIATWEAGGGSAANRAQLERALRPGPGLRVLLMNTEALSTPGKARVYLERFLRAHRCKFDVDEATGIKNPSASRTKYIVSVGPLAAYRRIMTGSPVTRSPMDLYSMFDFLLPGYFGRSFYAYRARYAVLKDMNFGGRKVTTVVGFRNLDDLTAKLEEVSYRVLKEECLDLPPKVYTSRDVDLTLEQIRMYDEMRSSAIAILEDGSFMSAQAVITQILRLHQLVCGHVTDDDGVVHDVPSNRLEVFMEVIAEAQGKVIVWSRYRRDIERIVEALSAEYGPGSVAQYHGGNTNTRQEDVARFLTDPECRFMISNTQSGGYGNTWIVATTVIYYSNDYDLERRLQSEDRAHRGGQTESVLYVDLIARGTVEEKIVDALRRKINISTEVMGDGHREWLI